MGICCSKKCPMCNKDYCCCLQCKRCKIQDDFVRDAFSIDEFKYEDLPDPFTDKKTRDKRQVSV